MAYDIFISYRRIGGEHTAKILRDHLQEAGYNVFFDLESLRSGEFNIKLYSVIDECTDFLLILSPNALDRCENEDDWVRREVEYALEKGKNVVPIMLRGFSFPDVMPQSIEPLRYRNGIEANSQFFDAFLQQLKSKFLLTKPNIWHRVSQNSVVRRTLPVFIALALVTALAFGIKAMIGRNGSTYPSTNAEKNLTDEVIYLVSSNLTNLDLIGNAMGDAAEACQRYLSVGEGDRTTLENRLSVCRQTLEGIDSEHGAPQEGLIDRLSDSPYAVDDVVAMYDTVKDFRDTCLDQLTYVEWLMGEDCHMSTEDKMELLSCYETIWEESLLQHACCSNELLLPITSETALKEFLHEFLPILTTVPLRASDWESDELTLESRLEQSFHRSELALMEISTLVGNTNMENTELATENESLEESIIENYLAKGCSREEAELLLEEVMKLRQLCLPKPGDDVNRLWLKMSVLLSHSFYDDARECVYAYWRQMGIQSEAQEYLDATLAFIDYCEKNGLIYGVMVMAYDETAGINEVLEIGDVIVGFNGEACASYEMYMEQKEQCPENEYTLLVLRTNDNGEMTAVELELSKDMPGVYLNTLVSE